MTTPTTVQVRLKLRQDTAANWISVNPVLLAGELGRESNTGKIKIGDGTTAWNTLTYQPFGASITNADIAANAEIAVSKLADGAPRQLLQTDAAGTGVEWASNIDVPGTMDVTGAATFDSTVAVTGALTKSGSNVVTVGDTDTVTSTMILDGTILNADINASAAIVDTKLATIATAGKVSNSATTATNANTASAIVARDTSGNFTAGTITAALTGTASGNLPLAGGTLTGNVILSNQFDARFREANANGSNYVGFQAPASIAADVLWTLPATDGTAGQVISTNGSGALSWATAGSGDVTLTGTQTLTNKTLTDPAIIGTILEDIFTITDGAAFEVDPGNGSIQLITLGASRTPKATNFAAGESITLMVNDGTAYTLTWTDATWGGSGVIWTGGSAPTLATTGYTVIQFWKVSTQVYGAYVGDVA